ncbi:hypothetical protein O6H91_12G058700 [Diphasiastrum complanatum]|uniref:Uncharacterized protein n=7 Tax=Diphasiastrum complanatum TaxID=34168 RepID=A0ACC2C2S3_DIPCM|nr:hypothetical protein O6H91_12G058700 [Diphasiastrum complanatum]KAJ7536167.1 hypothetical protein O6H91_12G058700 [Diphasiastrum complanatum]KAJ7536168.1 hypothetical protein O6H91_12G058700 [Diphasiastrum complanatum]KAJ7536169.1 hypothetical protein O6H91_12G058700 [Diphasiastrum complanatum]KAJ7536170.1 hypothetical protein O6H91_12G058700 [Diphasiastrum complanatum]
MRCFQFSDPQRGVSDPTNKRYLSKRSWSTDPTLDGETSNSCKTSLAISEPSFGNLEPNRLESASKRYQELRLFTYDELKFATKNFFRGDVLGEGGFGCVFKGHIRLRKPLNGDLKMTVAVKQLNRKGLQGHKEWLAEVNFLGLVKHPNLVKLVGYCAEDDERGMQRLLVYEYMPNKSLEEHLFYKLQSVLSWRLRIYISMGAARGLAYLHEEMDFQVIFRDFKTSNILLDNDFNPKLSDFGLARQGPGLEQSHVTTAVVGTVGYAAPEYIQTGHLTTKSDVWSFGVVLLELLTGRKAVDGNRPRNEQRLLNWVKPYMADSRKFPQMIDPRLEGQYSLRAAQRVAYIASQCLQRHPKSRPKMSEVIGGLQYALDLSELTKSPISITSLSNGDGEIKSEISQKTHLNPKPKSWTFREAIKFVSAESGNLVWHKLSMKEQSKE